VPDNPRRIIEFMIPGPRRMEWDSLMTSLEIVETLDEVNVHVNVQLSYEAGECSTTREKLSIKTLHIIIFRLFLQSCRFMSATRCN